MRIEVTCKQIAQGSLYYNNEDEFLEFSCSCCGNEWNNGWPVRLSLLMSIYISTWLLLCAPPQSLRSCAMVDSCWTHGKHTATSSSFPSFFVIILFPFLGDVWCSSFLSASVRYIHFRSPPSFFFLFLMAAFDGEAILSHPPTPELPSVCIITTTQSLRHHTTIEYIQPATHLFIIV